MKRTIKPILIWIDGENKVAEQVELILINDDLESSCTLFWSLKEKDTVLNGVTTSYGSQLAQGNITVSGQQYLNWNRSVSQIIQFLKTKLKLIE